MFSGIIEDLGVVKKLEKGKVTVETRLTDIEKGDSIAVNGVCLTVTKTLAVTEGWTIFTADVAEETVSKSTIGGLKIRNKVNLERALKVGGRFGGHMVTGHINGVGRVKSVTERRNSKTFEIMVPRDMLRYLVSKGSVAVDGVSLTIVDVLENKPKDKAFPAVFTISMISHTSKNTTFGFRKSGDDVNIEVDILSKYVEKMFQSHSSSVVTEKLLRDKGFFE
ncbi:MAG: riboflavin synthase [bacterium]